MTTWASRHPWLNPPTTKRKLPREDSDDDSSSETQPSACHRKRLRHDSLERTLAHMTLGSALQAALAEDVDMWPRTSPSRPPRVQETLNVVLPTSIEEPATSAASDSDDMEVEPTPATMDMPLSPDWDSSISEQLDIKEIQISSVLLECIKRHSPPIIPLPAQPSQALVVYRAPQAPCDDQSAWQAQIVRGDDVMEVE